MAMTGIEPVSPLYEGGVLPINYIANKDNKLKIKN